MLKELRNKSKMTQQELAFLSGVSIKTISRIENGDESVQYNTIKRLAEFFEVSVETIMKDKKKGID